MSDWNWARPLYTPPPRRDIRYGRSYRTKALWDLVACLGVLAGTVAIIWIDIRLGLV